MLTPRNLAIVAAAAGAFAGLPLSTAQACDNDRFPCPIVADTAQEATEAPARAAPAAQTRKKTSQTARQGDKPAAKVERESSQAAAPPKASKPPVQQADTRAKANKPTAPEQIDDPSAQKAAEAMPAVSPAADQPLAGNTERNESAPALAPAAAFAPASADSPGQAPSAPEAAAAQTVATGNVQVVDPNEVNELDLAAADPPPAPAESSWLSYLLMTLGGALAAASTVRLFLF
jgi:hypothetical protein